MTAAEPWVLEVLAARCPWGDVGRAVPIPWAVLEGLQMGFCAWRSCRLSVCASH